MEISATQFYHWFGLNRILFRWLSDIHAPAWDAGVAALSRAADPIQFPWYVLGALLTAYLLPRLIAPGDAITFAIGFAPLMLATAHLRAIIGLPRMADWADAGWRAANAVKAGDGVPSSSAALVFLFAASLSPGMPPPARIGVWLFAVLAGTARVAGGHAFPADVAGGALLAVAVAWILRALLRAIGPGSS
ncbi:MAG: phosphatase PAP2 family protein [Alphaproteobacteria bacterium]|nr:phosphatase PAP2 family protein [Alphaproteobacteria bacterium]